MTNLSGTDFGRDTVPDPKGEGRESPSSFSKYPAYKDSGVEWLGEVPVHWESWKIAHAFNSIGSGTTPPSNEEGWYEEGAVPWVTTSELRESTVTETKKCVTLAALNTFKGLQMHPPGSLAIAMYGATIGRLGILGVRAATNQACCVLSSSEYLGLRFIFYWLMVFKETIIALYASGGGQPNINQETIASLRVPAPSLQEQAQIARFLDHETAKIDALIQEQQRLIELLKEKRQAVISHAVTKGLDPSVPMKDSGVEWLGEVPAHWEVVKLRWLVRLSSGNGITSDNIESEGEYPVYGGNGVRGYTDKFTHHGLHVLIGRQGALCGNINYADGQFWASEHAVVVTPTRSIDTVWLGEVLRSMNLNQYSVSAAQPGLAVDRVSGLPIPVPPKQEQAQIAGLLDHETAKIDALVAEAHWTIGLLQERRSALISAAVTGKIDVRNWQPPADESAFDDEVRHAGLEDVL